MRKKEKVSQKSALQSEAVLQFGSLHPQGDHMPGLLAMLYHCCLCGTGVPILYQNSWLDVIATAVLLGNGIFRR